MKPKYDSFNSQNTKEKTIESTHYQVREIESEHCAF